MLIIGLAWDVGHIFTFAFSYELPLGRSRLLKGWQLAGTGRTYTGQPFTPRTTNTDVNAGEAVRPDRIAKGTLDNPGPQRWFDVSALTQVPRNGFRYGNSGRNVSTDRASSEATSLSKTVALAERARVEFRWDAFNAPNRKNFLAADELREQPRGDHHHEGRSEPVDAAIGTIGILIKNYDGKNYR